VSRPALAPRCPAARQGCEAAARRARVAREGCRQGRRPRAPKVQELAATLTGIADELHNPNIKTSQDSLNYLPKLDYQISGVGGVSDTADAKPTAAAVQRHKELRAQLQGILGRLDEVLTKDLGGFNRAVADAGIPPVIVVPFGT